MVDLKAVCTKQCVAAICSGVVRAMDVIQATFVRVDGAPGPPPPFKNFDSPPTRYFINCLGFGLGVAAATTAEDLRFLGQMRYDVGAFINIARGFHNRAKVELDGTTIDSDFAILVVSNSESMTFRFVPGAKVDDGLMDVALLSHVGRARVISLFDQVKKGYLAPVTGPGGRTGGGGGAHVFCDEVKHYVCKELTLTPYEQGTYNVDGEILGAGNLHCRMTDQPIEILFQ
jgi:diacylglycerol kinase family enzyme